MGNGGTTADLHLTHDVPAGMQERVEALEPHGIVVEGSGLLLRVFLSVGDQQDLFRFVALFSA